MNENEILEKLAKVFTYYSKDVIKGPGDDCAVIDLGDKKNFYLFTVDEMVEGTHFILDFLKPQEVASRLVRANVSDIYSMGDATPLYCLVSAGLNKEKVNDKWISLFTKSLKKELDFFGVKNIGGNLSRSRNIYFSMTVIGKANKKKILMRSGAKKGDLICAIGFMGSSKAAAEIMLLRKRENISMIEESLIRDFTSPMIYKRECSKISKFASAMLDNSDGLYKSALILAKTNNLRAIIDYNTLDFFVSVNLKKWCDINSKDPRKYVLFGGEDYNLIFSVPKRKFADLKKEVRNVKVIGEFVEGKGVYCSGYVGKIENFEHF
ncbi:MAG: thiamine-phosphate kinase [Elusimicrobiota bacterium]